MSHAFVPQPAAPPGGAAPPAYQIRFETISGTGDDLQLRMLLDRQQYHDPDGEAEAQGISSAAWPIFGMLWPSGRVLAHVMLTYEIPGKQILEIGCGLGLASLVAHRRGADVTASDCHPLAADFLLKNLELNHLPAMKYQHGNWSLPDQDALGCFDLIIGSDVLYDRGQPEILSQFIARHSQAGAQVLIVDPDRGNQPSFSKKMNALGFSHSAVRITSLPDGSPYKGKLHQYCR